VEDEGWTNTSSQVTNQDTEYVFMAHCLVLEGVYQQWSVICLSGTKGSEGPSSPPTPGI